MDEEVAICKVPQCVQGLPILLVDPDTTFLMFLASMLEQLSYRVTTTELTSIAMSMIREQKDRFKLVMANINIDDMNHIVFLRILVKENIPVILMSSERSENVAKKAIAYGACLHLEKPISSNDIKYLWQFAYRKRQEAAFDNNFSKGKNKIESAASNIRHGTKRPYGNGDEEEHRKDKRIAEDGGTQNKRKKPRVVWNQQLHNKFTAAVSILGDKNARPKAILEMMNEANLTHRQVASHLQKYKARVQRISKPTPGTNIKLQMSNSLWNNMGHQRSGFSTGNAYRFSNMPQHLSSAISSFYHNQQFPNKPQQMFQQLGSAQNSIGSRSFNRTQQFPERNFIQHSSISQNQSQLWSHLNRFQTTTIGKNLEAGRTVSVATTPATFTETQNQHSPYEFMEESNIEPHPSEVDRYCEWLKEALVESNGGT